MGVAPEHAKLHADILEEFRDLKENHLHHIYVKMAALETDGRWVKRFMGGTLLVVLAIVGGIFTLVAKAL